MEKKIKKNNIIIAPSILAGDFGQLADEAKKIEASSAEHLHIDIMDGHFVPNITMGPQAVAAINRATEMFLDVHLMIYNPFDYVERFVEAGADQITFHFEATENVDETLAYIRKCGVKSGLAFCPETSATFVDRYLEKCDNILLMTVHPGFGGQSFMPEVLDKIVYVKEQCNRRQISIGEITPAQKGKNKFICNIQVDGGITDETAKLCVEAGANALVAGTYLFRFENMREGVENLRKLS